ncbi:DUF4136 domain-containing protein [Gramella sp. GC03-9]|uniref:DUF4136 domain-containing protein n=1 Tax=Christiangramia oceanisediminis TaxID=2920386 RepID=A0A9X2L0G7_9FLAO|nr:DUF4136 domain-containing protein [Gramella oceanisediminis]MCP9201567.1 DUF4136 domain-containing protein [Gramella oceanisediminis]
MKIVSRSLLLLFFVACNSPQAVYDYDESVNFSNYSQYALFPDFRTGLSQLDETRLVESLNEQMREKGFSKSNDPGIYVNVYSQEFQRDNRSRVGLGVGGGGGNVGVGVSGGIPIGSMDTYLNLTFDFIDVEKDVLVWKAEVESPFNPKAEPQQRREQFDKIVEKALSGYPPKK